MKTFKILIEITVVIAILAGVYCSGLEQVEFFGDESYWIATSDFLWPYVTGQFQSRYWDESYDTLVQPHLVRYTIGVARRFGGYGGSDLNTCWNFEVSNEENILLGNMPDIGMLLAVRRMMALLAVFSLTAGFWLVRQTTNRLAGYTWVVLSATNSFYLLHLRRAMGEATLLACTLLAALACYYLLRGAGGKIRLGEWKTYTGFILMGAACGLAASAKLNAGSVLVAGLVAVGLLAYKAEDDRSTKIQVFIIGVTLTCLVAALVFLGLNPYLWPDPVGRTLGMFFFKAKQMGEQQAEIPESAILNLTDRMRIVPERILTNTSDSIFSFSDPVAGVIKAIYVLLILIGLGVIFYTAWKWFKGQRCDPGAMIFLLIGASTSILSLFTPLDWGRFYLYPIFFAMMLVAIGFGSAVEWIYDFLKARVKGSRTGD
jgi:4-amino-4-deoxy-L-arabinose transferase-like glycosyltransferase